MDFSTELKFTKFMLKKHPDVVKTIKILRRNVGNLNNLSFTSEQKEENDARAAKVRAIAKYIYKQFKVSVSHID